jgi:hypothetical protein
MTYLFRELGPCDQLFPQSQDSDAATCGENHADWRAAHVK